MQWLSRNHSLNNGANLVGRENELELIAQLIGRIFFMPHDFIAGLKF